MSTDYFAVCFTCKTAMPDALASGSIGYGFVVWDDGLNKLRDWIVGESEKPGVSKSGVGAHEGHDIRIVSEHYELPWEDE
jgi:hypothetical protein